MSEHITHLAVAEDSALLAMATPGFSPHFTRAIRDYPEALRLGSTTRSGDTFIFPLLKKWRDDWAEGDERSEKLAYVIGWAGHLAGDRTFKPTFRITDLAYYTRGLPGPSHASVYQDAAVYHYVYDDGARAPFHPATLTEDLAGHPAAGQVPVNQIEGAFAFRFADQLARLREFSGAGTDQWPEPFETMGDERQRYYVGLDRYTEATRNPKPERLRQYLLAPNFYNPRDELLQIARRLRAGEAVGGDLERALAAAEEGSLYAQSLKLGHEFYLAASDYFEHRILEEVARERMRTFQPHKQPLDYYVEQAAKNTNGR